MDQAQMPIEDRVRVRAYELWENDGRPDGRSEHYWHRARVEIDQGVGQSTDTPPASAQQESSSAKTTDPHPGMMGDGTEEQNLGQDGDPSARISQAEVEEAFGSETPPR
jgi:hypothetical protein